MPPPRPSPRPVLAGTNGVVPDSQARLRRGCALNVSVQGLPVALRGKTLDLFPETPEVIATTPPPGPRPGTARVDGHGAAVAPAQRQPQQPVVLAEQVQATPPAPTRAPATAPS
jgi:hypothetical protein